MGTGGGPVEPATLLDPSLGDTSHCWPVFLPDGVHFLYFVRSAQDDRRGLYLGRIDRPAAHADALLLRSDSNAVYVPVPGIPEGVCCTSSTAGSSASHRLRDAEPSRGCSRNLIVSRGNHPDSARDAERFG